MEARRNPFKQALREGRLQLGIWSALCSPVVADVLSDAGYDWVLIDGEHAPNDVHDIQLQLMALEASPTATPVVRVPWNDPVFIKRVLDVGARSILVPMVQSAAEARQAVAACRYPPHGTRGVSGTMRASRYGRAADYHAGADADLCVLVQVETRAALDALDDILAVEGVDGVFIGPADLAASLGHLSDRRHPAVREAIQVALQRIRAAGKAAGFLSMVDEDSAYWIEQGFTFVAVGHDVALLARQADALCARFSKYRR